MCVCVFDGEVVVVSGGLIRAAGATTGSGRRSGNTVLKIIEREAADFGGRGFPDG